MLVQVQYGVLSPLDVKVMHGASYTFEAPDNTEIGDILMDPKGVLDLCCPVTVVRLGSDYDGSVRELFRTDGCYNVLKGIEE